MACGSLPTCRFLMQPAFPPGRRPVEPGNNVGHVVFSPQARIPRKADNYSTRNQPSCMGAITTHPRSVPGRSPTEFLAKTRFSCSFACPLCRGVPSVQRGRKISTGLVSSSLVHYWLCGNGCPEGSATWILHNNRVGCPGGEPSAGLSSSSVGCFLSQLRLKSRKTGDQ